MLKRERLKDGAHVGGSGLYRRARLHKSFGAREIDAPYKLQKRSLHCLSGKSGFYISSPTTTTTTTASRLCLWRCIYIYIEFPFFSQRLWFMSRLLELLVSISGERYILDAATDWWCPHSSSRWDRLLITPNIVFAASCEVLLFIITG